MQSKNSQTEAGTTEVSVGKNVGSGTPYQTHRRSQLVMNSAFLVESLFASLFNHIFLSFLNEFVKYKRLALHYW